MHVGIYIYNLYPRVIKVLIRLHRVLHHMTKSCILEWNTLCSRKSRIGLCIAYISICNFLRSVFWATMYPCCAGHGKYSTHTHTHTPSHSWLLIKTTFGYSIQTRHVSQWSRAVGTGQASQVYCILIVSSSCFFENFYVRKLLVSKIFNGVKGLTSLDLLPTALWNLCRSQHTWPYDETSKRTCPMYRRGCVTYERSHVRGACLTRSHLWHSLSYTGTSAYIATTVYLTPCLFIQ